MRVSFGHAALLDSLDVATLLHPGDGERAQLQRVVGATDPAPFVVPRRLGVRAGVAHHLEYEQQRIIKIVRDADARQLCLVLVTVPLLAVSQLPLTSSVVSSQLPLTSSDFLAVKASHGATSARWARTRAAAPAAAAPASAAAARVEYEAEKLTGKRASKGKVFVYEVQWKNGPGGKKYANSFEPPDCL
eukprot:3701463-Prymnesium_polylepis.1